MPTYNVHICEREKGSAHILNHVAPEFRIFRKMHTFRRVPRLNSRKSFECETKLLKPIEQGQTE